ncbi:hypothetical protein LZ554_007300 [Drepanopeziza brunnea f. sp. 'monogermtubi']|nr:hypothetical protein LZ554_007300 [Drepanopeziza brunnea f. sp. 'monogermtubi']
MTCVLYEARLALFTLLILSLQLADSYHSGEPPCRYIPGDARWPSGEKWDKLNATVGGRLIATKPVASVCHDPIYNAAICSTLKDEWDTPLPFIQAPAEIMTALFQNQSCVPFTSISTPCTLGNYASFSINVTGVRDAVAGLKFAKDNNIRLVIKNTGHDYLGKSTGKGGLALWMHNLKSVEIIDSYKSRSYKGPAVKLGAGVIAADAYLAVHQRGYRIVGGSCPTVGLAGGYSQGGGHSSLSGQYGLGADNVLEWEVVTADGRHLVATPTEHEELFWALSGGGGGTFAVVLSMTTRLHADGPVGGGLLVLNITQTGPEVYWDTVELFHASLPAIVDTGATVSYQITNSLFIIGAIAAPNRTAAQVTALLSPVLTSLKAKAAPFLWIPSHFETFYDCPRAPPVNAVHPAWRETLMHCIVVADWDWTIPYSTMVAREAELTERVVPALEAVTPGSGTYLNEANFLQPHWQREFYGPNYPRLLDVKRRFDPDGVFYARTAVGSEAWDADAEGRLCRPGKKYGER